MGYFPEKDKVIVGGRTFMDTANLIVLVAYNGAGKKSTFCKEGSTTGYQVPSGKTFTVLASKTLPTNTNTSGEQFYLLYSDNDVLMSTTTAFTNPVTMGGVSSGAGNIAPLYSGSIEPGMAHNFPVPATKYVGVTNANGTVAATVYLYGYET